MTYWPWPLGGIQSWFEGLWNWISTAAVNAVNVVSNWIWGAIYWVRDRVVEAVNVVSSWIWGAIRWVKDRVSELVAPIANWIWSAIQWAWNLISGSFQWVVSTINASISWWLSTIQAGLTWIFNSLSAAVDGLRGFMETILHGALSGVAAALGEGLKNLINWLVGGLTWILQQLVGFVLGAVNWAANVFTSLITDIVNKVRTVFSPHSPPPELAESLAGLGQEYQKRMLEELGKHTKSPITPEGAFGTATAVAILGLGVAGLALTAGMAADASHPVKEWGARQAAQLVLGYLGVEHTIAPLLTVPYEQGVLKPLRHYFDSIYQASVPPAPDLIRFYVREAFRPELAAGIPGEFVSDMKLLGFSEKWTKYYWASHWIIPDYTQAREMFWRGAWTQDKMLETFRYADLAPAYNDLWNELTWTWPGAFATRWMYEWGMIEKADMIKLLRAQGLHPQWQERVADAYIKNQLRDEINRVRTTLISMYAAEKIASEEELRTKLSELGIRKESVDLNLQEAKLRRELAEKEEKKAVVKDVLADEKRSTRGALLRLLIVGKTSESEFRSELKRLGYSDAEADESLRYVAYAKKLAEKEASEAQLTKSDLATGWELGYVSDAELVRGLTGLGLTAADAEKLADITKAKALSTEINTVRDELITSYANGLLSEVSLRESLADISVPEPLVQYYVQKAKTRASRSEAEDYAKTYLKAFDGDAITETELRGKLAELGVQTWKIDVDLAYAKLAKLLKAKTAKKEVVKDILADEKKSIRGVLIKLLIAGKITESEFRIELLAMGYAPEEIDESIRYARYTIVLKAKEA